MEYAKKRIEFFTSGEDSDDEQIKRDLHSMSNKNVISFPKASQVK